MQVYIVLQPDVIPADILEEACQGLVLRGAAGFFPSVTTRKRIRGNIASVVAELFDHLSFYFAFEELGGRLCLEQPRFAVGKNPSRMGVRENISIDYGRGLLVPDNAPISPT